LKLDIPEAQAVCNLRTNPDWQKFLQAFGRHAEIVNMQLIKNEKEDVLRLQGRAQAVTMILEALAGAPSLVERYKGTNNGTPQSGP